MSTFVSSSAPRPSCLLNMEMFHQRSAKLVHTLFRWLCVYKTKLTTAVPLSWNMKFLYSRLVDYFYNKFIPVSILLNELDLDTHIQLIPAVTFVLFSSRLFTTRDVFSASICLTHRQTPAVMWYRLPSCDVVATKNIRDDSNWEQGTASAPCRCQANINVWFLYLMRSSIKSESHKWKQYSFTVKCTSLSGLSERKHNASPSPLLHRRGEGDALNPSAAKTCFL